MRYLIHIFFLVCCVAQLALAAPQFLTISDVHYGSDNVSGEGHDTGTDFLNITLNRLRDLAKEVDFILLLGDIPTHVLLANPSKAGYEKTVFHGLYAADQSLKPMFYITGNNDSLSGNYQPFEADGVTPLHFATDWSGACAYCEGLIIDDSNMYNKGYYSSYVIPGNKDIVLIALNTVQWTKRPFYLPEYPHQKKDAVAQLQWLEQQLKAQQAKQLIIAMHVPPGMNYLGSLFWHDAYLQQFIMLLEKYHTHFGQITLISSHTHMDGFKKILLQDGTNIYNYSTPGISRIFYNNPGMKIYNLNHEMKIKNMTTYFTSSLKAWGDEQYEAMGSANAIFPWCKNISLEQCLNDMSKKQVCDVIDKGLFYSVKNPRVPNQQCFKTYIINDALNKHD